MALPLGLLDRLLPLPLGDLAPHAERDTYGLLKGTTPSQRVSQVTDTEQPQLALDETQQQEPLTVVMVWLRLWLAHLVPLPVGWIPLLQ